jgi:ankyrin repeat protein
MPRQFTPQSTLENLKREAKRWLKALRADVEDARARLARAFPNAPDVPSLRDVQHALALEHGVPGWAALKNQLAGRASPDTKTRDPVERFLEYACPDHHVRGGPAHRMARHAAMRLLKRYPEIARDSLYTAIVCGDLNEVERILAERPEAAAEKRSATGSSRTGAGGSEDLFRDNGPKTWEPLLFLCFTRLPLEAASDNAVAIAQALLDRGADPNAYFTAGDSRYTPLVGVIGEGEEDRPPHPQRDALARLLLERGAEPYDMQVVYNIHFHGDVLWFLKLMYEFSVKGGRKADWDDPNWSMLDMGGYGNGARWHLELAVKNNNVELAKWVLAHGASPNAAPARDKRFPTGTPYEEALRHGLTDMAELLARHGATTGALTLEGVDAFVAACFRLDRAEAQSLLAKHPEYLRSPVAMFAATKRDRADVVALLLDLGVSPDVEDRQKQRPLHVAAYADSIRVAALLIERGAEIDPVDAMHDATPLWWAMWGQRQRAVDLLSRYSRDVWALSFTSNVARLRDVLSAEPRLATLVGAETTPLMWLPDDEATAIEIAELFLDNGADPSIKDKEGLTAADRAEKRAMFAVAELLRSKGPKPT